MSLSEPFARLLGEAKTNQFHILNYINQLINNEIMSSKLLILIVEEAVGRINYYLIEIENRYLIILDTKNSSGVYLPAVESRPFFTHSELMRTSIIIADSIR